MPTLFLHSRQTNFIVSLVAALLTALFSIELPEVETKRSNCRLNRTATSEVDAHIQLDAQARTLPRECRTCGKSQRV